MSERFLEGRVAWVTGGATGIGRAIVMGLAEAGADVAFGSLPQSASAGILPEQNVTTVNEGEHDETAAAALEYGSRILARPFDVSSDGDVATAHRDVVDGLGPVDILVNAAATSGYHPLVDHPDEVWTRILDTNLNGPFRTIRRCLGSMIARRWGRIINIGSTASTVGVPTYAAYCTAKTGLLGLTRTTALEGAPYGVSCNLVSPSWVDTPLLRRSLERKVDAVRDFETILQKTIDDNIPQGRLLAPEEVADLVVFLCRERALGITMENIQISAGAIW